MKIIQAEKEYYSNSINFVDEKNVFVGYDMEQSCCENANWFISNKEENQPMEGNGILDKLDLYNFDIKYFVEVEGKLDEDDMSWLDSGGMVRFKLISEGKSDLFLHLYNSHNGYYGHGFEFKVGEKIKKKGSL